VKSWRISFSLLLPILELTLWFVLVPTQAGLDYLHLRQMAHGAASLRLQFGEFTLDLPRNRFLPYALESTAMRESKTITAINMPGTFGEILVSLPTSWPESWRPAALPLFSWRAFSFPFFALPAWWFAGRGLDALLGWRQPRWWTLLIGTLLCAGFLTLVLGFRFGLSAQDRADIGWVLVGCALWTALLAPFPAVWIRQAFRLRSGASSAVAG